MFRVDQGENKTQAAGNQNVGQDFAGHLHGFDEGVAVQDGVAIGDTGFVVANAVEFEELCGCFDHPSGDKGGEEGEDDAQDGVFGAQNGERDGDDVGIEQRRGDNEGDDDLERGFLLHGFDQGHYAAGANGQDGTVNEGQNLIFGVEAFDLEEVFLQKDAGKDAEDNDNEQFQEAFVKLEKPAGHRFIDDAGVVAEGGETHHVHIKGVRHDQEEHREDENAGVALVFSGLESLGSIGFEFGHGRLVGGQGESFLMKQVFFIDFAQDGELGRFLLGGKDFKGHFLEELGFGSLFPSRLFLDFKPLGEDFTLLHAVQTGFWQAFEQNMDVYGFTGLVGRFLSVGIDHADLSLQGECQAQQKQGQCSPFHIMVWRQILRSTLFGCTLGSIRHSRRICWDR